MIAEIDIWRTAWLMVEHHGESAEFVTATRSDELLDCGDLDGAATWRRISNAVAELRRTERGAGEAVN